MLTALGNGCNDGSVRRESSDADRGGNSLCPETAPYWDFGRVESPKGQAGGGSDEQLTTFDIEGGDDAVNGFDAAMDMDMMVEGSSDQDVIALGRKRNGDARDALIGILGA